MKFQIINIAMMAAAAATASDNDPDCTRNCKRGLRSGPQVMVKCLEKHCGPDALLLLDTLSVENYEMLFGRAEDRGFVEKAGDVAKYDEGVESGAGQVTCEDSCRRKRYGQTLMDQCLHGCCVTRCEEEETSNKKRTKCIQQNCEASPGSLLLVTTR